MGRRYADEMALLQRSYACALADDWSAVQRGVAGNLGRTLVSVGSGGSMTTAAWAVFLHQIIARGAAHAATPLALRTALPSGREAAVWLMSGSGKNPDVLLALDTAVASEPHEIVVICASKDSPLGTKAARHPWVKYVGFENPAGSDGFLATNSLFASCVGLTKAFLAQAGRQLPPTLDALRAGASRQLVDVHALETSCARLWAQDTLIVLHGNTGAVAATDIESRFTEAALNCVQLADFRNFAHGRHHWLAKRSETSAVLAITDPGTRDIADRTITLLPRDVPVVRLDLEGDTITSALASLWFAMQLAGFAGRARGIDPGRPGVPEFGRKIYKLRTKPKDSTSAVPAAIRRKMGDAVQEQASTTLDRWLRALEEARDTLNTTSIEAVVLDYDGTLVEPDRRREPPARVVADELVRLLGLGVTIGIATGRGDSVRSDLRSVLPKRLWQRVVVGYHNGSEIATLDDDNCPPVGREPPQLLQQVHAALLAAPFAELLKIRAGRAQVTVETSAFSEEQLWRLVHDVVHQNCGSTVKVVRSSHSVDVIDAGASKLRVLEHLVDCGLAARPNILCIGDRGRWPGNDFELLDHKLGLSVDEVSSRHDACWNFAAPGERGAATAVRYLAALGPVTRGKRKAIHLQLEL